MDSEVKGAFRDRGAAELALEHLVQEIGLDRTAVFIAAQGSENSSGTQRSGADARSSLAQSSSEADPHLEGEIEMSIGCSDGEVERVQKAVRETGGRVL
jgi:hypothetical protein